MKLPLNVWVKCNSLNILMIQNIHHFGNHCRPLLSTSWALSIMFRQNMATKHYGLNTSHGFSNKLKNWTNAPTKTASFLQLCMFQKRSLSDFFSKYFFFAKNFILIFCKKKSVFSVAKWKKQSHFMNWLLNTIIWFLTAQKWLIFIQRFGQHLDFYWMNWNLTECTKAMELSRKSSVCPMRSLQAWKRLILLKNGECKKKNCKNCFIASKAVRTSRINLQKRSKFQ